MGAQIKSKRRFRIWRVYQIAALLAGIFENGKNIPDLCVTPIGSLQTVHQSWSAMFQKPLRSLIQSPIVAA